MELIEVVIFLGAGLVLLALFIPVRKTPAVPTEVKVSPPPLPDEFIPSHRSHQHQADSNVISMGELHKRVVSLESEIKQLKQDING